MSSDRYELGGVILTLADADEGPELRVPGVPDGFHPILEQVRGSHVVRGGPFDGVEAHIGSRSLQIGPLTLAPVDPHERITGIGQRPPALHLEPEEERQYRRLLEEILALREGDEVDYRLAYPKHRFVQWVTTCHAVIFHGSQLEDIDVFEPPEMSSCPDATTGQTPVSGVYGTHEGLWSLFFATLDRSRVHGPICSGVDYYDDRAGRQVAVYHCSVGNGLSTPPLRDGTLYLLPRDSFRRLAYWPGGPPSNEWASEDPVRPLARLRVHPEDFPLQVGTLDGDAHTARGRMLQRLFEAYRWTNHENGEFDAPTEQRSELRRFCEDRAHLASRFIPDGERRVDRRGRLQLSDTFRLLAGLE